MKLVLFDLDGTLIHAGGAGRVALNRAMRRLFGVEDACGRFSLAGRTDRQNFILAFKKALGREPSEAEYYRIQARYLEYLPQEIKRSLRAKKYFPIPGVSRLLEELSRRDDVILALGTGNVEKGAMIKLAPSGLSKHFVLGGFGGDSVVRKRLLQTAVRRGNEWLKRNKLPGRLRKKDVFVVGDTPRDVYAGRAAGYRTIAVATGSFAEAELEAARPDAVAADYKDLGRWLRWLGLRPAKANGGRRA